MSNRLFAAAIRFDTGFHRFLLSGSPAIDAGDNTDPPRWDQRGPGFPRIVSGTIDIGAFEVQAHAHGRPTGQPLPDPLPVPSPPATNALGPELSISGGLPRGPAESLVANTWILPTTEMSAGRAVSEDRLVGPMPETSDGQRAIPGPDLELVGAA